MSGDPFRPMNQMVYGTTNLMVGAGTLMLGFGALNMLGGMIKPPGP
jgi:hypothetical protein